ncbi:MAG: hypothetical protein K8T89_24460 [Planctomycetes bacterium]|nr:hypothetical protein [Planctomycetota bacterium]
MSEIKCPSCDVLLPSGDLRDGWCGACGKKVPMFVYHQAHLSGPKETGLPSAVREAPPVVAQLDPEEKPPIWQIACIGVAVIGIAIVIVRALM